MREIKYSNLFPGKAWFFSMLFLFLCFYSKPCEAAEGKELVIRYQIEKKEKVNPSYCMAIWLETLDGSYVKNLYASPDYRDGLNIVKHG